VPDSDATPPLRFRTEVVTTGDPYEGGRQAEHAINTCPVCDGRFQTLADEAGAHQCPDCGFLEGG